MARRASQSRALGRRQRGAALIALLAVLMMGTAWMLTTRLNEGSANVKAQLYKRNAEALNRAKLALIGYVAAQAGKEGESNPGALPCPEDSAYFGDANNEGTKADFCTLPAVGRLPWRSIGTEKLVDAYGEPLWFVVSTDWAKPSSTGNTVINSDTVGQLSVDGTASDAVALIIAPGQAMVIESGVSGCTAHEQKRSTSGTPNVYNYLECENATGSGTSSFITRRTTGTFNDQVVKITTADILPAIEAAIAARIEREIAPKLRAVYATSTAVGGGANSGGSTALLPLALAFSDPNTNALASSTSSTQGLLPLTYAETSPGSGSPCSAGTAPDWCAPNFVRWASTSNAPQISGAGLTQTSSSCSIATTTYTTLDCTSYGWKTGAGVPAAAFSDLRATASNVGAALRQLRSNPTGTTGFTGGTWTLGALASSGAVTLEVDSGTYTSGAEDGTYSNCGISWVQRFFFNRRCFKYTLGIPIFVFADHPNGGSPTANAANHFLTSGTPDPSWFLRNKWHTVSYYAVAAGAAPGGNTGTCSSSTSSRLTAKYHLNSSGASDEGQQCGLLVLAGRALTGQSRSGSSTLSNWLEGLNVTVDTTFELRSDTLVQNRSFNDRIALLSSY